MANTMTHTAFVGTKVAVQSRPAVCKPRGLSLRVNAKWAGNWLPGSKQPAYLEALPAAYGFVSTLYHLLTYFHGRIGCSPPAVI